MSEQSLKPTLKISSDGHKYWLVNGLLHRDDGPAIEYADGDKAWYLNGLLHRVGAPAYEGVNGYKSWRINDRFHREDGPAVERANGTKAWYYHGKYIDCSSQEEFLRLLKLKAFW